MNSGKEAVLAFVEKINSKDIHGMAAFMTESHEFVDSLGSKIAGKKSVLLAWQMYFTMIPDYMVVVKEIFSNNSVIVIVGQAKGTYSLDSTIKEDNFWEMPAAWRATVCNNLVASWQVYADNEPVRELIRKVSK